MTLNDLFDAVENNSELTGLGTEKTDLGTMLLIEHKPTHLITRIPAACVEKLAWEQILDVLIGKREPSVLHHMTRIVGYYSRLGNFNRSKIGEVKARIQGDYVLEGKRSEESIRAAEEVLSSF